MAENFEISELLKRALTHALGLNLSKTDRPFTFQTNPRAEQIFLRTNASS